MSKTPRADALDAELGVTDSRSGDVQRYRLLARELEAAEQQLATYRLLLLWLLDCTAINGDVIFWRRKRTTADGLKELHELSGIPAIAAREAAR